MKELTKGEWEFNDHGRIYVWGNGPETKGYTPNIAKVSIWKDAPEKGRANAQAIVTAVNNTYHKGIDPEGVPDMKKALLKAQKLLMEINADFYVPEDDVTEVVEFNEEALKKAGVNLNSKAE